MPKCPSCSKFCSVTVGDEVNDPEITVNEAEINSVAIMVKGGLSLMSECCGEEIGTMSFDVEKIIEKNELEKEYDE